jgi:hypothetical protein
MRALVVLVAVAGALALPTLATGGGWAAVGFEPLPDGMAAGASWKPRIFVKQHGVTPLTGLSPVVSVENVQTGESQQFVAAESSVAGEYDAAVVFPSAGEWHVRIDSGFGDSHVTYGPVRIGAAGDDGGVSLPTRWLGLAGVLTLLVGGAALLGARRSRRLTPASG